MTLVSSKKYAVVVLIAFTLLTGCGKSSSEASLKDEVEKLKQQLAEMQAEDVRLQKEVDELRSTVVVVESAVKDLWPKQAKNSGPTQLTSAQLANLQKVIDQCVQSVRGLALPGSTPINDVHITFDAYFNPASGKVENNNRYVDQSAVFEFNKCMTLKGWPLR